MNLQFMQRVNERGQFDNLLSEKQIDVMRLLWISS